MGVLADVLGLVQPATDGTTATSTCLWLSLPAASSISSRPRRRRHQIPEDLPTPGFVVVSAFHPVMYRNDVIGPPGVSRDSSHPPLLAQPVKPQHRHQHRHQHRQQLPSTIFTSLHFHFTSTSQHVCILRTQSLLDVLSSG